MKQKLLALFLAAAGAACGADWEFDHVVKSIEHHYGVKRTRIPFLGVANFFVKVARPAGAHGFKLALFEDLPSTFDRQDLAELDRFMNEVSGRGLQMLMVTHSRRDNESNYILTGEIGKTTKMLIATFERNEVTVVQVQLDIQTLLQTIGSREEIRKLCRSGSQDQDDR